jgi:hypothetical protein
MSLRQKACELLTSLRGKEIKDPQIAETFPDLISPAEGMQEEVSQAVKVVINDHPVVWGSKIAGPTGFGGKFKITESKAFPRYGA